MSRSGIFGGALLALISGACGSQGGGSPAPAQAEENVGTSRSALSAADDAGGQPSAGDCTSASSPAIVSDQEDYRAPTTVFLSATGLECGASYSVRITTPEEFWPAIVHSTVVELPAQTAAQTGAITFTFDLTAEASGIFQVELLDASNQVVATTDFHDSHFRYGHVTWTQSGALSSRTASFTLTDAWRRSAYGAGGVGPCYTPSGATTVCRGTDGRPVTGDIIQETLGSTRFNFGDGATTPILFYVVTAYDMATDWLVGRAMVSPADYASPKIVHTYAANGPYTAGIDSNARITTTNNTGGAYHVSTTVRFDVVDGSPASSLPPIVNAPANATDFHFTVPAIDNDGDVLTCRLATCLEAYDTSTCQFPAGMTVDPSCTVHWNTVGKTVGQLYTTQIHVDGTRAGVHVDDAAVDFLLQIVQPDANPPSCALDQFSQAPTTSAPGTASFEILPGTSLSFRVTGTDTDSGDTVKLNSGGAPSGATVTPALPISGASPEASTISWTPSLADVGASTAVSFTVSDQVGQQAQCSVTIKVLSPCPEGNACDDGDACTQKDTCHNNACVGSNPVVCTASDQCHVAGTCDKATGACTNPVQPDGTTCSDGNACTQTDACQAGACTGTNPVTCTASDQCHVAGTCDRATGVCSNPAQPNGTACTDGNACTQTDSCQSGACTGTNPVVCTASDQCHVAGTCDASSGACSNPPQADGTTCSDGNACTTADACTSGVCTGGAPPNCDDQNPCTVDSCNPAMGCVGTAGNPGVTCRPATSVCDSAEACTGTTTDCPPQTDTIGPTLSPGANQTVVGSCTSDAVTFTNPIALNSAMGQCDASAIVTCTTIAGNSYGDHTVTCQATDASGNVSNTVTFVVTVLEPLSMKILPPLYGDSTPAAPYGSVLNVAKSGSTVPVKVKLFACGTDVTSTASVTVQLGVQKKTSTSDPGTNVVPSSNGIGDAGGAMTLDGAQYHYNLSTTGYAVTGSDPSFYQLDITASYSSASGVQVGFDAIMLDTK